MTKTKKVLIGAVALVGLGLVGNVVGGADDVESVAVAATVTSTTEVEATTSTVQTTTTEVPTTTTEVPTGTTTEVPPTATAVQPTTTMGVSGAMVEVVEWIDGDTVATTAGVVRLIGIDTPEAGAPCSAVATANAVRLAPEDSYVNIVPVEGRDDTDRYDRLLRYVMSNGRDVGFSQIVRGLADARYDSGEYGTHPERDRYRRADAEHPDQTCGPVTAAPTPPAPTTTQAPAAGCDPSYPDFCIPSPPPDLDCADVNGNFFTVVGSDPHGFDGNNDGVGCES